MVASALSSVIIRCDSAVESRGNTVKSDDTLSSYLVSKRLRIGKSGAAISILIAFAVVSSASYGLWYAYYRPYTPDEVILHEHWKVGETRDVEGKITQVNYFNTTYGREVYVQLSGQFALCGDDSGLVRGDINKHYVVGERFRTTLHFTPHDFNNVPGVWAEEFICPTPIVFQSIGVVMDAVSYVMGFYLMPGERNETGWMSYTVLTREGDGYPLDLVNVTLAKAVYEIPAYLQGTPLIDSAAPLIDSAATWIMIAAIEYVSLSGGYWGMPVVDEMQSLKDGTSRNGTIRYFDLNGNNLLDDGDQFILHLDKMSGLGFQTYLWSFGGGMSDCGYICGIKYALNHDRGPYQLVIDGDSSTLHLRHVGDQIGLNVTSTIEVVQHGHTGDFPLSQTNFTFHSAGNDVTLQGRMADLPVTTADGVTIGYSDVDGNAILNAGDRFTIGGIANRTGMTFGIQLDGGARMDVTWIAGYGHIIGNIPRVRLAAKDTQMPLTINVSVPWWHQELNLSKHLNVSLRENSTLVLDSGALVNGSIYYFPGGNLTFIDGDANGFLSSGDYFILHGNTQTNYKVEISVLWGYATFSQEFNIS
jgi:hypothetical protein